MVKILALHKFVPRNRKSAFLLRACFSDKGTRSIRVQHIVLYDFGVYAPQHDDFKMKTFQSCRWLTRSVLTLLLMATCATAHAQRIHHNVKPNRGCTVAEQLVNAPINNTPSDQVKQLLNYAFQFRGVPYVYGAMSPKGFDCSGFTSYVYKHMGYRLDRTSRGQINNGRRVARNELKPGDLVFFNGRAGRGGIGHVGIVTEADNGSGTFTFIHAACSTGVRTSNSTESYYRSRYVSACRVIE